jgi:hypothetical protein
MRELQIPQTTKFIEEYRRSWKEHVERMSSDRIKKNDLKIPAERKKKFRKTSEMMEGFCFVIPIMGLSRTNSEDDVLK